MSFPRLNSVIYDENGYEIFLDSNCIIDYDDSEFDAYTDEEIDYFEFEEINNKDYPLES